MIQAESDFWSRLISGQVQIFLKCSGDLVVRLNKSVSDYSIEKRALVK